MSTAVLVRNLRSNPTTITPDPGSPDYIVFAAAGDPEGGDIQLVNEAAAGTAVFQRAVARNILVVEGQDYPVDPVVADHLRRQNELAEARAAKAAEAVAGSILKEADNDLLGTPCIGPDSRGAGMCGDLVSLPSKDKGTVPPLCERHRSLAGEYVSTEVADGDKVVTKWSRPVLGAREKAVLQ